MHPGAGAAPSERRVLVVDGADMAPARCLRLVVRIAVPGAGSRGRPARGQALRQLGWRRHQMEDLLWRGSRGGLVGAAGAGGAGRGEAELRAPAGDGQGERDRGAGARSCGWSGETVGQGDAPAPWPLLWPQQGAAGGLGQLLLSQKRKLEARESPFVPLPGCFHFPLPSVAKGPSSAQTRGTRIHPRDPPPGQDPHGCPSMPAYLAAGAGRRRSWTDGRRRLSRTPAGWGSDGSGAASPRWRRSGGVARGTGPAPSAPAASAAGRSTDPLPFHRLPCWRR